MIGIFVILVGILMLVMLCVGKKEDEFLIEFLDIFFIFFFCFLYFKL